MDSLLKGTVMWSCDAFFVISLAGCWTNGRVVGDLTGKHCVTLMKCLRNIDDRHTDISMTTYLTLVWNIICVHGTYTRFMHSLENHQLQNQSFLFPTVANKRQKYGREICNNYIQWNQQYTSFWPVGKPVYWRIYATLHPRWVIIMVSASLDFWKLFALRPSQNSRHFLDNICKYIFITIVLFSENFIEICPLGHD